MKKNLLIVVFILMTKLAIGQTGKVYDNLSMTSKILKGERKFAIYLPPGYETSERSYPVLYLLHGSGDDQTGWVQFGEVLRIADESVRNGSATPMIIVMPDGNTGERGYFNSLKGNWNYENFFFEELMPFVETKYRIKKEKRFRAISGLSMGGGGTFMYAMHHPELFSSACPLSAYVGPLTLDELKGRLASKNEAYDDATLEKYMDQHNALRLIESMSKDDLNAVRWFIDCGDDDFLYEGNSLAHIALKKKGVNHEYRVREGAHNWTYWRESLPVVLTFVSDAFHQY